MNEIIAIAMFAVVAVIVIGSLLQMH